MNEHERSKVAASSAYNAASDFFDHPINSFWNRFGQATIDRMGLNAGQSVLDVCCGSGASAIPAARSVGPEGMVLGVDLAENLIGLAREKALEEGLTQAVFQCEDMLAIEPRDAVFDAVVCVFGIFFVPDMEGAVRELWARVKPGGVLAITTWGPDFFEPANDAFWESIRQVAPSAHKAFNPWDRISTPSSLLTMLEASGVKGITIDEEQYIHRISRPEDWWTTVMGSGYRGTIEKLNPESQQKVRELNLKFIENAGVEGIQANVIYAIARKD
mgnify:FL=1